jgi:DNA primase
MDSDAVKEEIRERIDLVDLVSQYVELKQAGRNWKGLCPFHQEKTPSFNVNRESKFWKCFGCGAGGDVFSFVMRIENVAFPEAMRILSERAGLTWEPSWSRPGERDEREEIRHANTVAVGWFKAQLAGKLGAPARAYLESRGLDEETIDRFQLGYAPPGWDGLLSHLGSKGIAPERAERAGLVKQSDQGTYYDIFRNRIIFPICDVVGKVIAFGGRALDPEDPAKYLNSPETQVFRKGRTFYGLDIARRAISDAGAAIVVEGYMDVIALAQHGVENVVATLGTALTEQHAKVLARYTPEIILIYDADAAGMQAALRSARVFEDCSAAVKIAPLPEGHDPDDYVREYGEAGFRELLNERLGLVEYRLREVFSRHREAGPEGRTKAAREAADVLAEVPDIARRQALVAWAADQWAGSDVGRAARLEEALLQEMRRRARQAAPARRDEWQSVLAEKGIPRMAARRRSFRLARGEWLEAQRRQELLLSSIYVAKLGHNSPGSPGSPVNPDFIADALSRKASPFVRSVLQRERRMLTAMLERPDLATVVIDRLPPHDMLLPIHREIASAVAEAATAEGLPRLTSVADRLAEDEEVFAAAIDIALAEDSYDTSTLEEDIEAIREARLLGNKDIRLYNVKEELVQPADDSESLADLERQVQQGLAEGTLNEEDPLYQRYLEIRRQLHGTGELPYWDFD